MVEFLVKSVFPKARRLTTREAPGLIGCIQDIATKAACSAPPVYLNDVKAINAAIYPAGQSMLIFRGALDATGSTLHGKPSEQLEAIIAHEMGHWKNGFRHFGPMLGLLAGGGVIASGSVYLYDRVKKKQQDDAKQGRKVDMQQAFDEVAGDMKKESFMQNFRDYYSYYQTPVFSLVGKTNMQPDNWHDYLERQVRAVGANALALGATLPLCRPFALRNEYEADEFAVRVTGKPEVYIDMMEGIHRKAREAARQTAKDLGNKEAGESVIGSLGKWLENVMHETIMAHHSWQDRVAAIKKIAPTVERIHR